MTTIAQRVMHLTGITDEEYNNTLLDQGREYLKAYCQGDSAGVEALIATPEFWKWYTDMWRITDEVFVAFYIQSNYSREVLRERWHHRHTPQRMVCTIGADVLDAGYANMFTQVTNKQSKS